MIEAMAANGLWTSPGGATPWATLYSAITREIGAKGLQPAVQPHGLHVSQPLAMRGQEQGPGVLVAVGGLLHELGCFAFVGQFDHRVPGLSYGQS
jgi:hypothetical protein